MTQSEIKEDIRLLKGNEALALAAIRYGVDAYFGYPITPQSEILETMIAEKPWDTTGMTVLQAESETAAVNMVYGAAATGKKAMTSSSGPGTSLMQSGISYLAGANLPCLIVNVMRGGPGLGSISPSQADYFQATRGGGHGDYRTLVLAPASVQDMIDFVAIAFNWAFKYRNPAMILADGTIGQMMEKAILPPFKKRLTDNQVKELCPWASTGKSEKRGKNIITSIELDMPKMEQKCIDREERYRIAEENDVMFEQLKCDDANYIIVAFGSSARICNKTVELARAEGIKVGLLRPITLWPFPSKIIAQLARKAKGILVVELNAGQMIDDVKMAAGNQTQIRLYNRLGGIVYTPEEILNALKKEFKL